MIRHIHFQDSMWDIMSRAISRLARVVGSTMGPSGKHVLIRNNSGALIATKDGVTVAREYEPESALERIACDLALEASTKTVEAAGDGTTAAIVILDDMLRRSRLHLTQPGVDVVKFLQGFDRGVEHVMDELRLLATPCRSLDLLIKVATIASNHDLPVAEMVATTVDRVGKSGLVVIEDSHTDETTSEWKEGMCLDVGYVDPFFVTKGLDRVELKNCLVFIYDDDLGKLDEAGNLLKVFDQAAVEKKGLLVLCNNIAGESLQLLGANQGRAMFSCPVRAPGFGPQRSDLLQDVAVLTGGEVATESNCSPGDLGHADQVIVTMKDTIIIGGKGAPKKIQERAAAINNQIAALKSEYAREQYRARAARLVSGTATIKVGAPSDIERAEKKFRVEDAVHAAKSAVEEGVVPGGGRGLYLAGRAAEGTGGMYRKFETNSTDYVRGFHVASESSAAPMYRIYRNAGMTKLIPGMEHEKDKWRGIDARTGEWVRFKDVGILDSLKAQRCAFEYAASVARTMLTSDVLLSIDHAEEERKERWLKNRKENGQRQELGSPPGQAFRGKPQIPS